MLTEYKVQPHAYAADESQHHAPTLAAAPKDGSSMNVSRCRRERFKTEQRLRSGDLRLEINMHPPHGAQQTSTHVLLVSYTAAVLGSTAAVHGVRWGQPAAIPGLNGTALPTGHKPSSKHNPMDIVGVSTGAVEADQGDNSCKVGADSPRVSSKNNSCQLAHR